MFRFEIQIFGHPCNSANSNYWVLVAISRILQKFCMCKISIFEIALEEDFSVLVLEAAGGMLVQFGGLGMEGQQVLPRMVLVVSHLPVHRPEVAVDVEKVHIHGNLNAIPLQVFLLEHFLEDDHLSVRHRGDDAVVLVVRNGAVRHPEEPGDEAHEDNEDDRDRNGNPRVVDETRIQPDQDGADAPGDEDGLVGILVDADAVDESFHGHSTTAGR